MNVSTLFKLLALMYADEKRNGALEIGPVQFSSDSAMHPKGSLSFDLNNKKVNEPVENNVINAHENEITALQVWHAPNEVIVKSYYESHELASAEKEKSPRAALEGVLKSMEEQTCEKLHTVYVKIGEFNDFNYQKNQEIQYLSYTEIEKQKIILKSDELKKAILDAYLKLQAFVKATEKYRAKLTTWSDEKSPAYLSEMLLYWPQPQTIPELWYLLYNTETIMMQFWTPKPAILSSLDEVTNVIRVLRKPTVQMIPRSFIPIAKFNVHNNNAIDRLIGAATKIEDATNEFEPATFSKDEYEQKVIVFYMFKYFEYKTGDLARHVDYISNKLKQLEENSQSPDLIQIKQQKELLATTLSELQHATIQMETYRTIPELISVYNAEENAIKFLPGSKHITELIGAHNKRVMIKARNEVVSVLENIKPTDSAIEGTDNGSPAEIPKPLEWDKNWAWDF